jgi:hypothetical protein
VVLAPAPSPPKELTPADPLPISNKMRALMGRSPSRDPAFQVEAEQMLGVLARELGVTSLMQLMLVSRLTALWLRRRWPWPRR